MRTTRRLLIVPAILVLLVSCGSNKGSSGGTTTAPAATTTVGPDTSGDEKPVSGDAAEIVVKVGKDDSPDRVEHVTLGQTVELRLLSDDDEDYTVEGYDLEGKAAAGVEYDFESSPIKPVGSKSTATRATKVLLVIKVA